MLHDGGFELVRKFGWMDSEVENNQMVRGTVNRFGWINSVALCCDCNGNAMMIGCLFFVEVEVSCV